MDLGNILLFGIQFVCFVIAFIIGNTTGDWGKALPIALGGFIGGLVIGNVVGSIEDKKFKEKMEAEKKYNQDHAYEIAEKRFSDPEWFNERFYKRRNNLPIGNRNNKSNYHYLNLAKYYDVLRDIECLGETLSEKEKEDLLIYLLRGDDEYILEYLKAYERDWQISFTDDEKKKLMKVISVKNETRFKNYKKKIEKKIQKQAEKVVIPHDVAEDLFIDDTEMPLLYDEDKYEYDDEKNEQNFVKIYHLTDFKNIPSIRKNGIMSRSYVETNLDYTDIAESGALNNHRKAMINGVPLDNCARCFFNPMPPMYHKRLKEGYGDLSIIELHIPVKKISKNNKTIHKLEIDGSKFVKYYKQSIASHHGPLSEIEVHNINEIKWDSSKAAYDNNRDETIAKRGAELLIYPKIPSKYIYKVYMDRDLSTSILDDAYELGHPELIGEDYD